MPSSNMPGRPFGPAGDKIPGGYGPILTAQEARQGVVSGRVRMVLVISLVLCVAAFVIVIAITA